MNRIKIVLSLLIAFFCTVNFTVYDYAVAISDTKDCYSAFVSFAIPEPEIEHNVITNVLKDTPYLNAKIIPHFGFAFDSIVSAKIEYYFDGDDTNKKDDNVYQKDVNDNKDISSIKDGEPFFLRTKTFEDDNSYTTITYKFVIEFRIKSGGTKILDTEYYQPSAQISNAVSQNIGSEGGTVTIPTGDQSQNDIEINILPDEGGEGGDITVEILPDDWWDDFFVFAPKLASSANKDQKSEPVIIPYSPLFALTDTANAQRKYVIKNGMCKFRESAVAAISQNEYYFESWVLKDKNDKNSEQKYCADTLKKNNIEGCTIDVDLQGRTFEATVITGFTNSPSVLLIKSVKIETPGSCRPKRRAIIKNRGDVFEFAGLQDGDTLKIFNVNGKKVREMTKRTNSFDGFVWDGRNDSGTYVKSGIYIYQIKKADGKRINGTIVFAK